MAHRSLPIFRRALFTLVSDCSSLLFVVALIYWPIKGGPYPGWHPVSDWAVVKENRSDLSIYHVVRGTWVHQQPKVIYWAIDPLLGRHYYEDAEIRSTTFFVKWWLVVLVTAIIPAISFARFLWDRHRAKRAKRGLCPTCGYDLRASPERCPECGAPVSGETRMSKP